MVTTTESESVSVLTLLFFSGQKQIIDQSSEPGTQGLSYKVFLAIPFYQTKHA